MLDMATPKPILHVPYMYVGCFTLALPLVSLGAALTAGLYLHFDQITSTHCRVSVAYMDRMCVGVYLP